MSRHFDWPTPIAGNNHVLTVVIATLVLMLALGGLKVMHDSKVILSTEESAWFASQSSATSANLALLTDETVVTLERTSCFGECPAYEVSLFGSGRIVFRGHAFVCDAAPADYFIDRAQIAKLVQGLKTAGFLASPHYLNEDATDGRTSTITLRQGDLYHVVQHYSGDSSAPRLLPWMEDRIDEVAGTSTWLGKRQGYDYVCMLPDGTTRVVSREVAKGDS